MGNNLGFSYKVRKNGEVKISHNGRLATTLRNDDAIDFIDEMSDCEFQDQQQVMARITGNYKHGNERVAKNHPRNRR